MAGLFHVEDSTISSMLGDARFLAAFPCLAQLAAAPAGKGCGRCQKRRREASVASKVRFAKDCLIGLAPAGRRELKRLLNADKIRISRKNSRGVTVKYTY